MSERPSKTVLIALFITAAVAACIAAWGLGGSRGVDAPSPPGTGASSAQQPSGGIASEYPVPSAAEEPQPARPVPPQPAPAPKEASKAPPKEPAKP